VQEISTQTTSDVCENKENDLVINIIQETINPLKVIYSSQ